MWMIRCFGSDRRSVFEKEYREQTVEARMEFHATIRLLRDRALRGDWCRPEFDMLGGKHREIGKLRFKANSVQHRPLGFFGPWKNTFTLLTWATERDWKFSPPGVCDRALDRMKLVIEDTVRAHEFDF
jgi:hypothetical protein